MAADRRPPESDIDASEAEQYDGVHALKESNTPEGLLVSGEVEQTIFSAIDELPEDLRTAITLREFEGMSYEDIALTMDCPVGTVRSRIFRAREAISNKLEHLLS